MKIPFRQQTKVELIGSQLCWTRSLLAIQSSLTPPYEIPSRLPSRGILVTSQTVRFFHFCSQYLLVSGPALEPADDTSVGCDRYMFHSVLPVHTEYSSIQIPKHLFQSHPVMHIFCHFLSFSYPLVRSCHRNRYFYFYHELHCVNFSESLSVFFLLPFVSHWYGQALLP